MATITLRELKPGELVSIYPLIRLLNPDVGERLFKQRMKRMATMSYRAVAAFDGTRMAAVSGFWTKTRLWCGREFDIDNFVVHPDYRGQGLGRKLVAWLEQKAIREKAELIVLDSYVSNDRANKFYGRCGFARTGYHMTKIPGSKTAFAQKKVR